VKEFDEETQKQMERLYISKFQIQQMERKIAHLEGDTSVEESSDLQGQADSLQKNYRSKTYNSSTAYYMKL
jgi:hypothetical protein